ncbi:pentatricopeptide repeat-containing protein At4g19191, mitochondrial [Telopea speciosissima]|uniref:pentatricopeptide repeat-containing protein At4g19191, mitochondrial n=1 Tax=Telopea speciosissima TaxID=54955 RepID=UPI001CC7BCF1|nr:pentatricopeptide repeat-containing protein At4g19191, mitochondrial [Telopea speciosissima]
MIRSSVSQSFNRFSNLSAVALWNSNIRSTVGEGLSHKALLLFRQMKQSGLEPDNLTFPFVAKACAKLSNLKYSEIIHTHVVKSPFWSDIFVQTAMVSMYIKCGELNSACYLFEEMPVKDVASWNAMILGFAQSGLLGTVSKLLCQMRLMGFKPDSITLIALIQLSSNTTNLKEARAVHCFGIQLGLGDDVSVANTLIAAYAKCNDLGSAEGVFNGISLGMKSVVSWNSMISGCAHLEESAEAIGFYRLMCQNGVKSDVSTFLSLLSSCVQPEALLPGKALHSHAVQTGCDLDISVINTLISMYSKCGDINSARYLFNTMYERTYVSWTAMISGYAEKGNLDEALSLFYDMVAAGEKPDLVTVLALLSACGQTGALETGRWINLYAISKGLRGNVLVCNALIDMYAKCGSMEDAIDLFQTMPERTIITWTTMIAGYALNGESTEALSFFSQMMEFGLKPNHITFLAVLQACTHAGFLEKGWKYFNLMTKVYKVSPRLEHYACMADLLGRAGKLKEALDFILKMPVRPDCGVWGALLGACKIHQDIEIGEYVASRLFELEPEAAVSYVAMANIYAAKGKWDGAAKIRSTMKCKKVRKFPGRSLIQVNGKTHVFTVEDRCHPEELQIYEVLDGLALQLKESRLRPSSEDILPYDL